MIKEYLLKKGIDVAFKMVTSALKESKAKLQSSTDDLENSVNHHLREVKNWSFEISFVDLRDPKETAKNYIHLDVLLVPKKSHWDVKERIKTLPIETIFAKEKIRHFIILGQPGAGKTTSMKYLIQGLLYNENFLKDRFTFPILIRLRDLNLYRHRNNDQMLSNEELLFGRLYEILGIRIIFPEELTSEESASQRKIIRQRVIIDMINSLRVVIILDGFDEIAYKTHKEIVLKELSILTSQLEESSIILTSRTGEFNYNIENTQTFEINPLTENQITRFACTWLGEDIGLKLISELRHTPFFDTTIRPLTIAHLCAIYERIGKIPEKPKTVYRKIVNLLIQEWDEQRSIKRASTYAHFETDRKFEFLTNLAFLLTTSVRKSIFSKDDLITVYKKMNQNYGLPAGEALKVANELETHNGLFVQAGYDLFEFSHKSFQEYLTAEYIVRLPSIPKNLQLLSKIPNELSIAVSISSSPSEYFSELVFDRLMPHSKNFDFNFTRAFVNRLLIEKPDFNKSPIVGFALLTLYSIYLDAVLQNPQLYLIVIDVLAPEFDALSKLIRHRLNKNILLELYSEIERTEAHDGEKIIYLKRNKLDKFNLQYNLMKILPERLLLRPALIDESNSTIPKLTTENIPNLGFNQTPKSQ